MALSDEQIAKLALGAGLDPSGAAAAVAYAKAESSGNPRAINRNRNGSVDRGLWQINSIHRQFDPTKLLDPAYNADAMAQLSSKGKNWQPWSASEAKARGYLPDGIAAVKGLLPNALGLDDLGSIAGAVIDNAPGILGAAAGAITAPLDFLRAIAGPLLAAAAWLGTPANWWRIAQVIGAFAAIVGGIVILNRDLIGKAL